METEHIVARPMGPRLRLRQTLCSHAGIRCRRCMAACRCPVILWLRRCLESDGTRLMTSYRRWVDNAARDTEVTYPDMTPTNIRAQTDKPMTELHIRPAFCQILLFRYDLTAIDGAIVKWQTLPASSGYRLLRKSLSGHGGIAAGSPELKAQVVTAPTRPNSFWGRLESYHCTDLILQKRWMPIGTLEHRGNLSQWKACRLFETAAH